MCKSERGALLLEAMVAIGILSFAGAGATALISGALRDEQAMMERESDLRSADRVLAATSLLTRADLDRRLGRRQVGEFIVDVQRPEPALYRLTVSEVRSAELEVLVTVVYRPEP